LGLKADGTVRSAGYYNSLCSEWTDIIGVAANFHTNVGLKADGTVVVAEEYDFLDDATEWRNIEKVAVEENDDAIIGLTSSGTVVSAGFWSVPSQVSSWRNIVDIACGGGHYVGLKADGTVVAAGDNDDGECNVSGWTDIMLP
jgi:hypothetical protein